MKIRPNDIVLHKPSGEEWVVCGINKERPNMSRTKCGMCDFGNASNISKDTIPIATTGCVYKERGNPPQELRDVTGRLSLEKSLYPLVFNVVVTVSGIDPDVATVTKFVAKFPTKTCPKCGKALWKPKF